MKTIGLIGGTGWVSTLEYYRIINEEIHKKLGGQEYARCILYSLNFGDINRLKNQNDQNEILNLLIGIAQNLIKSGAEELALCANTMHHYAGAIQANISVPLIHIGDATALTIKNQGLTKVGLLGTKTTMESQFYLDKLSEQGITAIVPELAERDYINSVIFNELFYLSVRETTRKHFLEIITKLKDRGAEGIILGCTEIPLLIQQKHTTVPLFDTLRIHADAIVDFALNDMT